MVLMLLRSHDCVVVVVHLHSHYRGDGRRRRLVCGRRSRRAFGDCGGGRFATRGFGLLGLHAAVLEPNLDLALCQAQVGGQLGATRAAQVPEKRVELL